MSMSTHVIGFRPPDENWKQMKAIYDACTKAKVSLPEEVEDYFNGEPPDPQGVKVELEDYPSKTNKLGAVKDWRDDMRGGFEVDVTKLPKGVTLIRFYNSY